MKGIVAFDSVNGNTKQVAEAIADEIGKAGHQVEVYNLREAVPQGASGDFMFVGSPTRAGNMTKPTRTFLDRLDAGSWGGRPIIAFDTVGPLSKDAEKRNKWLRTIESGTKTAANRIQETCRSRGLKACPEVMHLAVVGMWGPLAPDALEIARSRTRQFLERMK